MLPTPAIIVSDLHLGVAPAETERRFVAFVRAQAGRAGTLIVNGDLFDFWFEWGTVIPRVGYRVLAALAEAREAGMEVLWLAGNHDCWGGRVLREDVGVRYEAGPWTGPLGAWRARIEHGDGLRDREDRGYRALRRVIRHRWSIGAFRLLHPDWGSRLATGSSHASRTYRAPDDGEGLRRVAFAQLSRDRSLDLVVYGHSHVASLDRSPNGSVYGNAGSWLDAPTYLELSGDRVSLRRWDGSAEGECLHALDRAPQEALPQT